MKIRKLQSELWMPLPAEELFPFFGNAHNLNLITPKWLHVRVLTPPTVMIEEGTLLDYRLRLRGIPIRWQSEITMWDPPHRFVDQQRRGPYQMWIHEHTFDRKEGGTLVQDFISFAISGGSLFEPFVFHLFVGPDVERIFEYRRKRLQELFQEGKLVN